MDFGRRGGQGVTLWHCLATDLNSHGRRAMNGDQWDARLVNSVTKFDARIYGGALWRQMSLLPVCARAPFVLTNAASCIKINSDI